MSCNGSIPHLGWSSHVYPLDAADFAQVPDYEGPEIPAAALPEDDILLYIRPDGPDALLRGRAAIDAALRADVSAVVQVRIVFKPSVAKWNLAATVVRVLRNCYRYHGTGRYHIAAAAVRAMGLERTIRTLENPQARGRDDRSVKMRKLEESLCSYGYDDAKPINIMLCRTGGSLDSLRQGHHRVSACLACGVPKMCVEFSAAGALPRRFHRNLRGEREAVPMVAVAIRQQIGSGIRRVCYALPDRSLCLKSYRTDADIEAFNSQRAAKGDPPLKQTVVKEIQRYRFSRARNTNAQEYDAWKKMRDSVPDAVMRVFPGTMELVCDVMRGWSVVEERVDSFDGRPVKSIMYEVKRAFPELRVRLLEAIRRLRDELCRYRVRFFDPQNVKVQWLSSDDFALRIVDFEPITRTFFPIDSLFPFLVPAKVRRRFDRLLAKIESLPPEVQDLRVFLEGKYINDVFFEGMFHGTPCIVKRTTKAVWSIGNEYRLCGRMYGVAPTVVPRPLAWRQDHAARAAEVVTAKVSGPSLTELLARGVTDEQADGFAADIRMLAEALKKEGILHRDLFPDNLLLDSDGHLKAIDWQLAIDRNDYREDPWVKRHWKFHYVVFGVNRELGLGVWNDFHALGKILALLPQTTAVKEEAAWLAAGESQMTFASPPNGWTRFRLWLYGWSLRFQMRINRRKPEKYARLERRWRTIRTKRP